MGPSQYEWDSEHRLVRLTKPGGTSVEYRYDGFGKRVQATRSSDGRVTSWGYDREQVAAVWRDPDGPGGAGRELVQTFLTSPSGDPLQALVDGDTLYPVLDGLGSVTATLDGTGGLVGLPRVWLTPSPDL